MSTNTTDDALARAITDAEQIMKAMSLTTDPAEKKQLSEALKQQIEQAERLKAAKASISEGEKRIASSKGQDNTHRDHPDIKSIPAITTRPQLAEPLSRRTLGRAEQILLLKAGFLNGDKFPPWTKEPVSEDFDLKEGESLHHDDSLFSLSAYQQKVFAGWERPDIALARVPPADDNDTATMDHIGGIDLVQDASTDCSVVASLCAGVARALRGHSRLLRPVLFPQDTDLGVPMLSRNGKYIVRLNFNGCYRRVVIDDRLPASKNDRIIHVIDRLNPRLLWPALVEKAYLKIRGGYDFPGSNSATDLWIITGWLPEQVFLQSDDLDLGSLWTKMCNAFAYGDVLITMGTGKMSRKLEKEVGLAGEHDYAVIDIKEVRGQRLMLVKNPWCEGTNWYRVPRRRSSKVEQETLSEDALLTQSPRDLLNADEQLSPGTFWMDIDNAAQYFESIYLNWNPGLFKHRQDLHFAWDLSGEASDTGRTHSSLHKNPQLAVASAEGGTLFLLLCRHFRNVKEGDASAGLDLTGFIALSAYAAGGKRIRIAGRSLAKTNFVDSPQILLKLQDTLPGVAYTVTPLEQELTPAYHTFTLCAFSNTPLSIMLAPPAHPHSVKCASSWTKDTAGGNAHSTTYSTNPQFKVVVTRPTKISILLEAANQALNVHVKMVHGQGERVYQIRNQDILFDSSDYRRRCCVAESKSLIDPGSYTAICSTFEPQQYGDFELLLESDAPVALSALPREGAGRLEVDSKVRFAPQRTRMVARLSVKRLARFYTVAKRALRQSSSVPLRISVEQGHGSQQRLLLTSENTAVSADEPVRLQDFDVAPEMRRYGDLYFVLERVCIPEQAGELLVSVTCFIDQLDALDIGEWVAVDD